MFLTKNIFITLQNINVCFYPLYIQTIHVFRIHILKYESMFLPLIHLNLTKNQNVCF